MVRRNLRHIAFYADLDTRIRSKIYGSVFPDEAVQRFVISVNLVGLASLNQWFSDRSVAVSIFHSIFFMPFGSFLIW